MLKIESVGSLQQEIILEWPNSLRARSIRKTYQPAFFSPRSECATYQPAIDQSDWPIQTVIVQVLTICAV